MLSKSILLLVTFVALMSACGSDRTTFEPPAEPGVDAAAPTDAATPSDASPATDLGEPTVDATSDAAPNDAGDAAIDDPDLGPIPDGVCECPDPLARCDARSGLCIREDVDCEGGELCPADYRCMILAGYYGGDYFCGCRGECGPICGEGRIDCTGRLSCDWAPSGPLCRELGPCGADPHCQPGQVCIEDERLGFPTCQATGDLATDAPCTDHLECQSGICDDGLCAEHCRVDADCPVGEHCASRIGTGDDRSDGCYPGSCDIPDCDPAESRCDSTRNECRGPNCYSSGDCASGDCVVPARSKSAGFCFELPSGPDCAPGEIRFWRNDPYCRLPIQCDPGCSATGAGRCEICPDGYDCLGGNAEAPGFVTTYCSRTP